MKKSIFAAVLIVASAMPSMAQKLTDNADSLGYYIGATQGAMFNNRINSELNGKDVDKYKKEFLKGLKETLLADTSRAAYRRGQAIGLNMVDELGRMREAGQSVDLKVLFDTFASYFNAAELQESQYRELYDELVKLMEPTRDYYQRKNDEARDAELRERQRVIDANITAGANFIDSLKAADPTVKTTDSGLVYKVIKEGEGPKIAPKGQGMVRYTGRLVDGTQFDSSGDTAYRFGPQGVIRGFGEGLMLMNKGAKYILYIPQDLAYGVEAPPAIGPGQTLIFEVEVDEVIPPKE